MTLFNWYNDQCKWPIGQTQHLIIAKKVDNKRDPLRAVRAQLDLFPNPLGGLNLCPFLPVHFRFSITCLDSALSGPFSVYLLLLLCISRIVTPLPHLGIPPSQNFFLSLFFLCAAQNLDSSSTSLTSHTHTHTHTLTQWVASSPTAVEAQVPSPLHLVKSKVSN